MKQTSNLIRIGVFLGLSLAMLLLSESAAPARAAPGDTCELTWTVVPNPNLGGKGFSLARLGGRSPTSVWAVGSYMENEQIRNLVAHWNGADWAILPAPNVPNMDNSLDDVAVIADDDVWALGAELVHWDGAHWTTLPRPEGEFDLTAFSGDDLWLTNSTAIWRWDGAEWKSIPLPPLPTQSSAVAAVAVRSSQELWAVVVGPTFDGTLDRRDGSSWSVVSQVGLGAAPQAFLVLSPTDIWVGDLDWVPLLHYRTGALHWDGISWQPSLMSVSDFGTDAAGVREIDGLVSDDVWALDYVTDLGTTTNRLRHWNGSWWFTIDTPKSPWTATFSDLAVIAPDDVWGLGNDRHGPFILHGALPCATLPAVPVQVSPAKNATVARTRPVLRWQAVPGVNHYYLDVNWLPKNKPVLEQYVYDRRFRFRTPLEHGVTYKWRVQACNNTGCGDWSPWHKFTIE